MSQPATYTSETAAGGPRVWKGYKLTKDQLEHVIEMHRKGVLVSGGSIMYDASHTRVQYSCHQGGCIMQHLREDPFPSSSFNANNAVAAWFDDNYKPTWADWMLREALMKAGLVEE